MLQAKTLRTFFALIILFGTLGVLGAVSFIDSKGKQEAAVATAFPVGTLSGSGSCQNGAPLYQLPIPARDASGRELGWGEIYINGAAYTSPSAGETYTFSRLASNTRYACQLNEYYYNGGSIQNGYAGGPEQYDCSFTTPSCSPTLASIELSGKATCVNGMVNYGLFIPTKDNAGRSMGNGELYLNGIASFSPTVGTTSVIHSLKPSTSYTCSLSEYYSSGGVWQGPESQNCSFTTPACTISSPAPTCTLTVSPTSIVAGQRITLSWKSTNASSTTLTQASTQTIASGTASISLSTTTTYEATFKGPGGSVSCKAVARVTPDPIVSSTTTPSGTLTVAGCTPQAVGGACTVTMSWVANNTKQGNGILSQVNVYDAVTNNFVNGGTAISGTNYFPNTASPAGSASISLRKGSYNFNLYGYNGVGWVLLQQKSLTVADPTPSTSSSCGANATYTINVPSVDSLGREVGNGEIYLNGSPYSSPTAGAPFVFRNLSYGTTYTYLLSERYWNGSSWQGPETLSSGSFTTPACPGPSINTISPSVVPGGTLIINGLDFSSTNTIIITPAPSAQGQSSSTFAAVAYAFGANLMKFYTSLEQLMVDLVTIHWNGLAADIMNLAATSASGTSSSLSLSAASSNGTSLSVTIPSTISPGRYVVVVKSASGQSSQSIFIVAQPQFRTMSVSSSSHARGFPAESVFAGLPTIAWVAATSTKAANNFAWIQFDLGQEQYVNTISWDSVSTPYPANVMRNYVVKVSDDGSTWTPVYAQFATSTSLHVNPITIAHNARYLRVESTKVGDASGWAASMSNVQISMSPPVASQSFACTTTLSPSSNYQTILASLRGSASSWTNVCFSPGTYTKPVVMTSPQRVRLLAPQGGVIFKANVPYYQIPNLNQSGCSQSNDSACIVKSSAPRSVFEIDGGSNIYIQGITFNNTYQFKDGNSYDPPAWSPTPLDELTGSASEVANAVLFENINNITLANDTIQAPNGKSPLVIANTKSLLIVGGSISGYYFEIDTEGNSGVYVYQTQITSNNLYRYEMGSDDYHSVIWENKSDITLDGVKINTISGRGIVSGEGGVDNRITFVGSTSILGIAAGALGGWGQINSGYHQQHIFVTDSYPTLSNAFVLNTDGGLGSNSGSFVCFYAGSSEQCTYPSNGN